MQPNASTERQGIMQQHWVARPAVPLLARFIGKFVLDIMPAALASVIGGFLFTQYQFGHATAAHPPAEQVTPASAEMMALVRDEHAMIIDYLKTQVAAEKSRQNAEDAADAQTTEASAVDLKPAEAKVAETPARRVAASAAVSKALAPRAKAPVVIAAAPRAPLVIAQADPTVVQSDGAAPASQPARDPDSFLGKTLDLRDHMVAATRHVVGMIGDVFDSVGERFGGATTTTRQFNSESWIGPTQ
jgi:hypothetical protein